MSWFDRQVNVDGCRSSPWPDKLLSALIRALWQSNTNNKPFLHWIRATSHIKTRLNVPLSLQKPVSQTQSPKNHYKAECKTMSMHISNNTIHAIYMQEHNTTELSIEKRTYEFIFNHRNLCRVIIYHRIDL